MRDQQCVIPCSEKDTLTRIEKTVNDMHKRLFVGNGGPSMTVQVDRNTEAVGRLKQADGLRGNRWWEFGKLLIAAALPVAIIWLAGKL